MDPAFIKQCADPALKPAIVEQFVSAVGSGDPTRSHRQIGWPPHPRSEAKNRRRGDGHRSAVCRPGGGSCRRDAVSGGCQRERYLRDHVRPGRALRESPEGICDVRQDPSDREKMVRKPHERRGLSANSRRCVLRLEHRSVRGPRRVSSRGSGRFSARKGRQGGVVEAETADAAPTETEAETSNPNDVGGAGIRIDLSRIGGQK